MTQKSQKNAHPECDKNHDKLCSTGHLTLNPVRKRAIRMEGKADSLPNMVHKAQTTDHRATEIDTPRQRISPYGFPRRESDSLLKLISFAIQRYFKTGWVRSPGKFNLLPGLCGRIDRGLLNSKANFMPISPRSFMEFRRTLLNYKPSQKKDFGSRSRRMRNLKRRHTQVFRGFKFRLQQRYGAKRFF
jgi:hypothetical protein